MSVKPRSRIFAGTRVLGYVSTHVPVVTRFIKRRGETLLVTSVGKWFHTYGCDKFRLLSVSGEHPAAITCMSGDSFHVYTASQNTIFAWRRGCELKHVYKGHNAPIFLLFPFGVHIISIDEDNVMKIFDIKEETEFLELLFDADNFKITTLCHPPTYLNKILLGSQQGQLQLWNIRTSRLVYTFPGWGSAVTVIEAAPAVDVVAICLANGKIILHNLRYDKTVVEFVHDWGAVTSLAFRLDGVPVMVTGSSDGHIVLWDLEEHKVLSQVESAHSAAVAGLQCFMSEPLMVTNSSDNSLKLWIFDMSDGGARLLKKREGHSLPPNLVHHCEPSGANILTAGTDSTLQIMNTISETFNKNMGKACHNRKALKKKKRLAACQNLIMPPIIKLSTCMQRDKQWDSIAALHKGRGVASTWSYNKIRMGDHKLLPPKFAKGVQATCLIVTSCGNFVIIGYDNGEVHKFNMQSGMYRGQFGKEKKPAHKGAVRGVETDICNQRLITAGADDKLKFWHFRETSLPFHVLRLEESVSSTKCHRESGLLAISNEDFTITLVDIDTMVIVRKFDGHFGKINDITFDSQSRWLISCSMDNTICTWDIPTSQLVDIFYVERPCTSLSMSPTGDYLTTTHVGEVGVFLWANKLLYDRVFLKPIDRNNLDIPKLELPTTVPENPDIEDIGTIDLDIVEEYKSPLQLSQELITLSNEPTSRWLNLLHLDAVKRRNKPKTPLTIPKSAPFFLPTIPSLDLEFDLEKDKEKIGDTKLLIPDSLSTLSPFAKRLLACETNENYEKCIEKLKTLSPSHIEIEVVSLSPDAGGSIQVLKQFMSMVNVMFVSNKDYELAQSYFSLFIKTHTKLISETKELCDMLDTLEESVTQAWSKLQKYLMYNICVVKALKDM